MLSADGCVIAATPEEIGCCPPPLCGNDLCCTFVAFMNLLPSGPIWDFWKQSAIDYFQRNPEKPEECPLLQNPACPSIVLHAIYAVLRLRHVVHNGLWVALRESNVYTAITTLDDHLARLRWEDCYNQHCRSVLLGEITPYEIYGECGPVFCPTDLPDELECAVKRGIAIALTRANMGVIKNICGINWVIDPLGAEINAIEVPVVITDPNCDPYGCEAGSARFEICQTRDWIEGCGSGDICETHLPRPKISAMFDRGCDRPAGLPSIIWPGVLAAECIVRSMMPANCPPNISRCC
jgi:hypothetical protein